MLRAAIATPMGGGVDWEAAASFVVEAERLGVSTVWTAEAWGFDAVSPLAFFAARTKTIKLGTGIMQIAGRTPAMTAMTALAMASLTNGRFILGLGASGPQVVEGWHGQPFGRTPKRLREYIDIVRMATRGERVSYEGELYRLPLPGGEGKALKSSAPPRDDIPIHLATLSPKSLELTGEIADGWVGTSFMPEHADVFFDHIRAGAAKAGRNFADIELQAGGAVAFGDDLERLIAARRPGLAFTLGAMGSRQHNFYNAAFRRAGYADLGIEVQRTYLEGRRQEAASMIPDEMVLQTNLLGTDAMVKDRIRAYRDCGITVIRVDPAGESPAERIETLGRFMQLLGEVNREG